jgi:hypothetical protein
MYDTAQDDMLRYNPSQIQLTSNDIDDLEQHTINRRRALSDVVKGKARLSTGPRLPTFSAAAHEDGISAHHSSTATVHPPSHQKRDTRRPHYAIPARGASEFALQPNHKQHDGPAPATHSGRIPTEGHKTVRDDEPVKIDSPQASPSFDPYLSVPPPTTTADSRIRDRRPQSSPSHHPEVAIDSASESGDVECPRPPSATRHTTPMHAGRQVFRELPGSGGPPPSARLHRMSATRTRPHERFSQSQEESPERPPPTSSPRRLRPQRHDPSPTVIARDLDPGVPALTARVRFGSATVVPERGSEDIDHFDLRIRSPSEQNASANQTRHSQVSAPASDTRSRRPRSNAVITRSQQSSENSEIGALPLPNLERYPLILPTTRNPVDRESRAPVRSGPSQPSTQTVNPSSKSPSSSSSSPEEAPASRIPSIVSAASGISKLSISNDAAAEFLRFRSSPLDGLTAELSRLSAALGPATIAGEKKISLLNGNPFDVSGTAFDDEDVDLESSEIEPDMIRKDAAPPKLLSSPSHITLSCSQPLPDTSIPQRGASRIEGSPSKTPSKTTTTETKTPSRHPANPTAAATPKLPIYNDATPAHLQPQTPADLRRSCRHSRNRSDSSIHREAFFVGQALVAPRPPIPERRAYRNTYPANINVGSSSVHAGTDASAGLRRGDSDESENGETGLLDGLESDRAVWARRRQGGSLDVTPPGQGRFERFLD